MEMNMNPQRALLLCARAHFPSRFVFQSLLLFLPFLIMVMAAINAPVQTWRTRKSTPETQRSRGVSAAEYYNRGNQRQKEGDLDGAIEDYTFALTFDSRYAMAWNNRGVLRYLKGNLD